MILEYPLNKWVWIQMFQYNWKKNCQCHLQYFVIKVLYYFCTIFTKSCFTYDVRGLLISWSLDFGSDFVGPKGTGHNTSHFMYKCIHIPVNEFNYLSLFYFIFDITHQVLEIEYHGTQQSLRKYIKIHPSNQIALYCS